MRSYSVLRSKGAAVARRLRSSGKRVVAGVSAALFSAGASAQTVLDMPTHLASAETFMETKGAIALGVVAVLTLITLGIKGGKLPRRA